MAIWSAAGRAATQPSYDRYPAQAWSGKTARIQLSDTRSREYAAILRKFARQKPNFAGHFVLATWGCGAGCVMGAAIDVETGAVAWLPFTVCCWNPEVKEPLVFEARSRLLEVNGSRNEHGEGVHHYLFDRGRFEELTGR
jgi:hypothetical protein